MQSRRATSSELLDYNEGGLTMLTQNTGIVIIQSNAGMMPHIMLVTPEQAAALEEQYKKTWTVTYFDHEQDEDVTEKPYRIAFGTINSEYRHCDNCQSLC
jgi:hypothetical protein